MATDINSHSSANFVGLVAGFLNPPLRILLSFLLADLSRCA
jgi:hypothetical protein